MALDSRLVIPLLASAHSLAPSSLAHSRFVVRYRSSNVLCNALNCGAGLVAVTVN